MSIAGTNTLPPFAVIFAEVASASVTPKYTVQAGGDG